ncbi:hypothetical protein DMB37_15660 [Nocardia sp. CS682]|nr:hypothetical protein DMB37_15660 [Nocardia sp. CS682]
MLGDASFLKIEAGHGAKIGKEFLTCSECRGMVGREAIQLCCEFGFRFGHHGQPFRLSCLQFVQFIVASIGSHVSRSAGV